LEGEDLLDNGPHYLQTKWVLWFDGALQAGKRAGPNDWAKQMKRLSEFDTIEQFWGTVHNVPPPSKVLSVLLSLLALLVQKYKY